MQNALTTVTQNALTEAQTQLAAISNGLATPNPDVKPLLNDFLNSLNALLNIGIFHTDNVAKTVNDRMAKVFTNVANILVNTGNRVFERKRKILERIYKQTLNVLDIGNTRTNNAINRGATIVNRIINRVGNLISRVLGIVIPQFETCSTKLTSLGMANAANGMKSTTSNATAIFKSLNDKLDAQFNALSGHVNTTSTTVTVSGASITARLFKNITDLDESVAAPTQAFDDCLAEQWELVGYLPIMINDNLALCADAAITEANATDSAMDQELKALQTSSNAVVTNICDCVATITSSSNMVLRAQASTCASNALKSLDTAPIQEKGNQIASSHKKALEATTVTYDACIADIIEQLAPLEEFVESQILTCKP